MKTEDKPDKATRALQRAQREKSFREMIKGMEIFYDRLESGESVEELEIAPRTLVTPYRWTPSSPK
jgi:hypothetical protein